jgi:hypothetical protein
MEMNPSTFSTMTRALLVLLASLNIQITPATSSSQSLIETRIWGGEPSEQARHPYIVSLTYFGTHFCGGSLIAPDIVLSAAHCAGYSSSVDIGRFDRKTGTPIDPTILEELNSTYPDGAINLLETEYYESIEVEYEIKHPSYDKQTVDYDFMILKLSSASAVPNPPLVNLNTDPNIPSESGQELLIMGWGDTDPDPIVNAPSDVLLGATVNYLTDVECMEAEGVLETDNGAQLVSFRPMITVSY